MERIFLFHIIASLCVILLGGFLVDALSSQPGLASRNDQDGQQIQLKDIAETSAANQNNGSKSYPRKGHPKSPASTPERGIRKIPIKTMTNGYSEQSDHHRSKRAVGPGVPDVVEFSLVASSPYDTDTTFMIGSLIRYTLQIRVPATPTDFKIEIFSQLENSLGFFHISNVRITSVGENFGSFDARSRQVDYRSVYYPCKNDFVLLDMGNIVNDLTDINTASASNVEVTFDVLALDHDSLVVGSTYRLSVGILYGNDLMVAVAQDDLVYAMYPPPTVIVDPTITVTGPDSIVAGDTGVFTITASIHDLLTNLSVDVYSPMTPDNVMITDRVSIGGAGFNYQHSLHCRVKGNSSRMAFAGYGPLFKQDLGVVLNTGYHRFSPNDDLEDNTIKIEVAITMLDTASGGPYPIGFTLYSSESSSVEIIWAAQLNVTAVPYSGPNLPSNPLLDMVPSVPLVKFGGLFSVFLNITLPKNTISDYAAEIAVPLTNTVNLHIERFRVSKVGFAMPHYHAEFTNSTTLDDAGNAIFLSMNLGKIATTSQGGRFDKVIQIEAVLRIVEDSSVYSDGDLITVIGGLRHSGDRYWVGDTTLNITTNDLTYTSDQLPVMDFDNSMGVDAELYPDTAAVMDLDIVLPSLPVYYQAMQVTVKTPGMDTTNTKVALRVLSMNVVYVGSGLAHKDFGNVTFSGLGEILADESEIYNTAVLNIEHLASVRDSTFNDKIRNEVNKLTVRTVVVARGLETGIDLTDNQLYNIEASVSMDANFIYAANKEVRYRSVLPNMYADPASVQPTQELVLADWSPSNNVRLGGMVEYNAKIGIPYRTAASAYVKAYEVGEPMMICAVDMVERGEALIDHLDPTYTGQYFYVNPSNNRPEYGEVYWNATTSFKEGEYEGLNSTDSQVTFKYLLFVEPSASVGSTYNFQSTIRIGAMSAITTDVPIVVTSEAPVKVDDRRPEVDISHYLNTSQVNLGSSEWFYVDIYTVPYTSYKYTLDIYAASSEAEYGEFTMLAAFPVSVGEHMTCSHITRFAEGAVSASTENPSGRANVARVDLQFVPNIAEADVDVLDERNKIRVMTHIAFGKNFAVGSDISFHATVMVNDVGDQGVSTQVLTVVADDDEVNTEMTESPTISVSGSTHDKVFDVGETLPYTATVTVPVGAAYTNFSVLLESPLVDGEALHRVIDLAFVSAGANLAEAGIDYNITESINDYGQQYSQLIHFNFLRNSNRTRMSPYATPDDVNDNKIVLSFNIRLLDHVTLNQGYQFHMIAQVLYSNDSVVAATGDTLISVNAPSTDATVWSWNAAILAPPVPATRASDLIFTLDLSITEASKRFPDDVEVYFGVPSYSVFNAVYDYLGFDLNYTSPTENLDGVRLKWSRLRYDNVISLKFSIKLDPNSVLEDGLLTKTIKVPVYLEYNQTDKSDLTKVTSIISDVKILKFTIEVPETYADLGIADSTLIQDCQITASSYADPDTPAMVRLNSASGWSTKPIGAPLYQTDYIQVDMGNKTRFTGVSIQPYSDSTTLYRITSFRVQYSSNGIIWNDIEDSPGNAQVFTVAWTANDETEVVRVQFASAIISRHLRLIPLTNDEGGYSMKMRMELHGAPWPYKSSRHNYVCPEVVEEVLMDYVDRIWLPVPTEDIFVCMLVSSIELPYCSASNDFGLTWFALDENVMNVIAYANATVFAISRDRKHYLGSNNKGQTWSVRDPADYEFAIANNDDYVQAKALPIPLAQTTPVLNYALYGFNIDATHTWSVSDSGVYPYVGDHTAPADPKNKNPISVAQWGDDTWLGPTGP